LKRVERPAPNDEDVAFIRQRGVFTTHTPVPAGHDRFPMSDVSRVLEPHGLKLLQGLGIATDVLNMTHLALHLAGYVNGVSLRHGEVSQELFAPHPIDAITNGVHPKTWVCHQFAELYDRYVPQWKGDSFLLREVMERAASVEEALAIIQNTPRTCEYYYVVSDKTGAMCGLHCLPDKMEVLHPGQQHPLLPEVPEDAVFVSAGIRAETLSRRLRENYGRIDAAQLMEIIKRPVAMESNLHDAILAPETLEMWFADAGRTTPACDEPYTHVKLDELLKFYEAAMATSPDGPVRQIGSN
ncbi:MAG TPA: hypothetical protein PKN95_15205, partial [Verrucomicrobiota bacterium]|nr:hypothetical protein [Verrucomicrobiota bacterium]